MDSGGEINLGQQGGIAVFTVFLLDYLKRAEWFPWLNANSERVNHWVSLCCALGTTVGLKIIASQGNIHTGGTITISYPSLVVLSNIAVHVAAQFGGQEMLHKMMGNHVILKDVCGRLEAGLQQLQQVQIVQRVQVGQQVGQQAALEESHADIKQSVKELVEKVEGLPVAVAAEAVVAANAVTAAAIPASPAVSAAPVAPTAPTVTPITSMTRRPGDTRRY